MLIRGFITGYNSQTLVAYVQTNQGNIKAKNYLIPGQAAYKAYVNSFLIEAEKDTVLPSHNFNSGDPVILYRDGVDSYLLLGKVDNQPAASAPPPTPIYEPGKFTTQVNFTTDSNGIVKIEGFARRAYIRKINVLKSGIFTCKIYDSNNQLQASWGDGEVILENELDDNAGFFFESENAVAIFELLPAGSYQVSIVGERFS